VFAGGMKPLRPSFRGRGTPENPANRFEPISIAPETDATDDLSPDVVPLPRTQFLRDTSSSIVTYNDSPDLGFRASINPYRGCEHGCIYCYARPYHEYLGFSAGLDFESKILVKPDAPSLLRRELESPRWKPQCISLSGVTDPYQPVERRLCLTRQCLEVLAECRNPAAIVTKNHLVTRDIDLLSELSRHQAVIVFISITSLDDNLIGVMEPRTSRPVSRLDAIRQLTAAGIPVGLFMAPIIPGLTDHEIPSVVKASHEAGVVCAGCIPLRLPHGVGDLFVDWLDRHFPHRKKKVIDQIRSMRGGNLNDGRFGHRMDGDGIVAEQIAKLFAISCRRAGIPEEHPELSTASFRRPSGPQLTLL
jgi:DNA repair photolyase